MALVLNQNQRNLSVVSVHSSKSSSKSEAGCSCERVGRAVICRRKDAEVDSYKCANYELEYFVELCGRAGRGARADKGMDIGIGETGCAAVTRTR